MRSPPPAPPPPPNLLSFADADPRLEGGRLQLDLQPSTAGGLQVIIMVEADAARREDMSTAGRLDATGLHFAMIDWAALVAGDSDACVLRYWPGLLFGIPSFERIKLLQYRVYLSLTDVARAAGKTAVAMVGYNVAGQRGKFGAAFGRYNHSPDVTRKAEYPCTGATPFATAAEVEEVSDLVCAVIIATLNRRAPWYTTRASAIASAASRGGGATIGNTPWSCRGFSVNRAIGAPAHPPPPAPPLAARGRAACRTLVPLPPRAAPHADTDVWHSLFSWFVLGGWFVFFTCVFIGLCYAARDAHPSPAALALCSGRAPPGGAFMLTELNVCFFPEDGSVASVDTSLFHGTDDPADGWDPTNGIRMGTAAQVRRGLHHEGGVARSSRLTPVSPPCPAQLKQATCTSADKLGAQLRAVASNTSAVLNDNAEGLQALPAALRAEVTKLGAGARKAATFEVAQPLDTAAALRAAAHTYAIQDALPVFAGSARLQRDAANRLRRREENRKAALE